MSTKRTFFLQIALLLLLAWDAYVIAHQQLLLREQNEALRKATAQLQQDTAVMDRLRKACHFEQALLPIKGDPQPR